MYLFIYTSFLCATPLSHVGLCLFCGGTLTKQDQNAGPLNQLDTVMEETYSQIVQLADKVSWRKQSTS
jgi:hypothetical protein